MKDIAYIITIVALIVMFFFKNNQISNHVAENTTLKNNIDANLNVIDSIKNIEKQNILTIDSLINEREKIRIIYKTIYKEYEHKDSVVNSFTINDIQDYWTNRYKD